MSGEAELLAKILDAPDDDGPRLVLADLLSAKGDPRGELITLQCRLAASRDDEARRKLRIAENKLLEAHGPEWTRALLDAAPPAAPLRANKLVFHRGFLEEAAFPLSALDDLEPYFAAASLLRRLRFDAPEFLGTPRAPPSLKALGLSETSLGDEGAKLLATSSSAARLESLELQDNKITQQGVMALADSTKLGGLRRLLLNDAWLGKKANLECLAASTALAGCRIYVKGTLISGEAKKAAAGKPAAPAKTKPKKKARS